MDPIVAEIRSRRGQLTILAKKLSISRSAIGIWKQVPAKHAVKVGKFLGLHPHFIRPDIYPPPRKRKVPRKSLSNVVPSERDSQAT